MSTADEVAEYLAQILEHRWHAGWHAEAKQALVRYWEERDQQLALKLETAEWLAEDA